MPCERLSSWKIPRISIDVRVSRLPVGSSARSSGGRLTRARAIATRCCWPPESWFGRWCSRPVRPTAASASRARSRCCGERQIAVEERQLDVLQRRSCAGARLKFWKTKPIFGCGSQPARRARAWRRRRRRDGSVPRVGRSRQPMMFMNVDLPEPEAPMMAMNSPRRDVERDVGERRHRHVAELVDLPEVSDLDERAVPWISGTGGGPPPTKEGGRCARRARSLGTLVGDDDRVVVLELAGDELRVALVVDAGRDFDPAQPPDRLGRRIPESDRAPLAMLAPAVSERRSRSPRLGRKRRARSGTVARRRPRGVIVIVAVMPGRSSRSGCRLRSPRRR